jgi:hypothetical protein
MFSNSKAAILATSIADFRRGVSSHRENSSHSNLGRDTNWTPIFSLALNGYGPLYIKPLANVSAILSNRANVSRLGFERPCSQSRIAPAEK